MPLSAEFGRVFCWQFDDLEMAKIAKSCVLGWQHWIGGEIEAVPVTLANGLRVAEVRTTTKRRIGHERALKVGAWMEGFKMGIRQARSHG